MNEKSPNELFQSHPRSFEASRFVYPVLSRRSNGISIGVNINPDKVCNFNCVYCQVNRSESVEKRFVELDALERELNETVQAVTSGRLFEESKFSQTPEPLRRLNDIALSGDGEPTIYTNFEQVVKACADVRRRYKLADVKLVLITNASLLHRVQRGLALMHENNGEIWAKLDAGTEDYYKTVSRSAVPFDRILNNITTTAQSHPIVIQSLFMKVQGQLPSPDQIQAYCDRLNEITSAGGQIKLVQIHTVARPPAEVWVSAIPDAQLDKLANTVSRATSLQVATFYG